MMVSAAKIVCVTAAFLSCARYVRDSTLPLIYENALTITNSAGPVARSLTDVLPPSRIVDTLSLFHDFLEVAAPNGSFAAKKNFNAAFDDLYEVVHGDPTVQSRSPFQPLTDPADGKDPLNPLAKLKKLHNPELPILSRVSGFPSFVPKVHQILCAIVQCPLPTWPPSCDPVRPPLEVVSSSVSQHPQPSHTPQPPCLPWPGYPTTLPPPLGPDEALDELQALANGTLLLTPLERRLPLGGLAIPVHEIDEALSAVGDFIAAWKEEHDAGTLLVPMESRRAVVDKRLSLSENEVYAIAGAVAVVAVCAGSGGLCAATLLAAFIGSE
jgi:hypothetical protein